MTDNCPCCGQAVYNLPTVDSELQLLRYRTHIVKLGPRDAALTKLLTERLGEVVPNEVLMAVIFGATPGTYPKEARKIVKSYIYRIRLRIRHLGLIIRTIYSQGYKLESVAAKQRIAAYAEKPQKAC